MFVILKQVVNEIFTIEVEHVPITRNLFNTKIINLINMTGLEFISNVVSLEKKPLDNYTKLLTFNSGKN